MTITLRQESATGATTKGSALTYAELDNNFVHLLRQGSVTVRGDSGTDQTLGEADKDSILQLAGGTDISTTISSDSAGESVVTIAYTGSAGIANVVEDTTPQLGGALDAQSNNITNLGTINTHTVPGGTGTFALTSDITFSNVVDDTSPQLGGQLDVNGQAIGDGTRELLTFTEDGSAVNHVNIENEATGAGPIVSAAGDDTNVNLHLKAKGTGQVVAESTINTQTGTSYTTVLGDASKLVTLSNGSAITLTIPPNSSVAYPTGTKIDLAQLGAGQVTVAEGSGVTVNATPTKKLRAQYSAATCIKTASDTWLLVGDLASS